MADIWAEPLSRQLEGGRKKCGVVDSVIITLSVFHDNRTGYALRRSYCPHKRQDRQDVCVRWVEVKYGGREAWMDELLLVVIEWKSVKNNCGLGASWRGLGGCIADELWPSNAKWLKMDRTNIPLHPAEVAKSADFCLHYTTTVLFTLGAQGFVSFSISAATPALRLAPSWHRQGHWAILDPLPVYRNAGGEGREGRPSALTLKAKSGVSILHHVYVYRVWEEGRREANSPHRKGPGPQKKESNNIYQMLQLQQL